MNCEISIVFRTGESYSFEGVVRFQTLDSDGRILDWGVSEEGIEYLSVGPLAREEEGI